MASAALPLRGKVALVTGASRGIGLAVARQLAADGAHTILAARNVEACRDAASKMNSAGLSASAIALDVADHASASSLASKIASEHGRLDIVVNNAGILGPLSSIGDSDPKAWHAAVAINLLGPYNVCRAMLGLIPAGGTIISVSSSAADAPVDKMSAYCSSKAGLMLFTRALADECSPAGITVIGFRPGRVDTSMHETLRVAGANALSKIDRATLAATEIPARTISFLCSPQGAAFHGMEMAMTSLLPAICKSAPISIIGSRKRRYEAFVDRCEIGCLPHAATPCLAIDALKLAKLAGAVRSCRTLCSVYLWDQTSLPLLSI